MSKICRPPSAAGKFFTRGQVPRELLPFLNCRPQFQGGGTHFTLGSVHFWPFSLRELQGGVKNFFSGTAAPPSKGGLPHPIISFRESTKKTFFTKGCTPSPSLPIYDAYLRMEHYSWFLLWPIQVWLSDWNKGVKWIFHFCSNWKHKEELW